MVDSAAAVEMAEAIPDLIAWLNGVAAAVEGSLEGTSKSVLSIEIESKNEKKEADIDKQEIGESEQVFLMRICR